MSRLPDNDGQTAMLAISGRIGVRGGAWVVDEGLDLPPLAILPPDVLIRFRASHGLHVLRVPRDLLSDAVCNVPKLHGFCQRLR